MVKGPSSHRTTMGWRLPWFTVPCCEALCNRAGCTDRALRVHWCAVACLNLSKSVRVVRQASGVVGNSRIFCKGGFMVCWKFEYISYSNVHWMRRARDVQVCWVDWFAAVEVVCGELFCSLSTNDGLVSAKWCLVWPRLMDSVHLLADLHGWWTRKRKQEVLKTTSENVSWIGDTSSYWGLFGAEICVNTYHKKPVARAVHASMRLLHFRCCSQPLIGSPDGFSLLANVKLCSFTVKAC